MDWATFLENNSQSIFTLGGVLLGSLIPLLITYINNRFLAKERDKDRHEQRREAKIQLKLELTKSAMQVVDDSITNILKLHSEALYINSVEMEHLSLLLDTGILKKEEYLAKSKSYLERLDITNKESKLELDTISRIAYSFDDEISTEYGNFAKKLIEYFQSANTENLKVKMDPNAWFDVKKSAGNLQRLLREKLLSIRDSE